MNKSKLAYRIYVILIANEEFKKMYPFDLKSNTLYFRILLHSFNNEYLFFCPSM
jgi:hypothetical protein